MATESVTKVQLEHDYAKSIQDMLLDAIKAKVELELLWNNVQFAAKAGLPAQRLVDLGMSPRPVDLDIADAADMVQLLTAAMGPR